MLPQCCKVKSFLTESGLPPIFAQFCTSSVEALKASLFTTPAKYFTTDDDEKFAQTEAVTKKPDVPIDFTYFHARWAEQIQG